MTISFIIAGICQNKKILDFSAISRTINTYTRLHSPFFTVLFVYRKQLRRKTQSDAKRSLIGVHFSTIVGRGRLAPRGLTAVTAERLRSFLHVINV